MKHTLTFLEQQVDTLQKGFFNERGHERSAYIFCNISKTSSETRFIVNEVEIVPSSGIQSSSPTHISIRSESFIKAIAKAARENKSLFLMHNHPKGYSTFSSLDNEAEKILLSTAYNRNQKGIYGSLVMIEGEKPKIIGRVTIDNAKTVPLDRVRIVGKGLRLYDAHEEPDETPLWASRHVLAFGKGVQGLLGKIHVGVVGTGGTGSAVCEQLIRLGVKNITIVDEDKLENSNVTRVYGSRLSDEKTPKVKLIKRLADEIGFDTTINDIHGSVCTKEVAAALRDCDIIFGCTDDAFGRRILNKIAIWYSIPVIDMAVFIDSTDDGVIKDITGRVTILLPGNGCLICRGRITQEEITAQALKRHNPEEYARRVKEGYIRGLDEASPSVIMFTSGIASRAIIEFIHMLTGFIGEERTTTEVLERYHESDISRNSTKGEDGCICVEVSRWSKGDEDRFLGMTWGE